MKKILSALFMSIVLVACEGLGDMSGDGNLQGIVTDSVYETPVEGCKVVIIPGRLVMTTDNEGKFEYADLKPGDYIVRFSKDGYKDLRIDVAVQPGEITDASTSLVSKSSVKFAGGKGTFSNPYIITTLAHMQKMQAEPELCYALGADVDLCNVNWKPFEFSGSFDGRGFKLLNLYIDRIDNCQGLFSILKGTVKNLTVQGVKIDAPDNKDIGVIAGKLNSPAVISDCKVIFTAESCIKGYDCVGGITGEYSSYGAEGIYDCEVVSESTGTVIVGNDYVGGIMGYGWCEGSHAKVNISGTECVGGVLGKAYGNEAVSECSYSGTVAGSSYVGGIAGSSECNITLCKSDAEIKVEKGYAGGLAGYGNVTISASYATGKIVPGSGSTDYLYGLTRSAYNVKHSYSTVTCSSSKFDALSNSSSVTDCCTTGKTACTGSNIKSNCTDIVKFMKECYSEYDTYWDYTDTWTWRGSVSGKTVNVTCPKLEWE